MKPVTPVLVLVGSLAAAGPVRAETWARQLTPGKTADNLFSFAIKAERQKDDKAGASIEFRVTVTPKPGAGSGRRSGTLEVFAGEQFVSSCEVHAAAKDGTLSFTFRVAAKYAEKSKFIFAESFGEAGAFYYWFYLADFADSAPPAAPAATPVRVENDLGFRTLRDGKSFRGYWGKLADDEKLTGKLSDHLAPDQVASAVALEVNIAVAQFFQPTPHTSLDDELRRLLSGGGRFHTGRLPEGFEDARPPKAAVLLIRTKDGEYGLLTFYSGFVAVELKKGVGVVLDEAGNKDKDEKGKGPGAGDPPSPRPAAGEPEPRAGESLAGMWAVTSVRAPKSAESAAARFKDAELTFAYEPRARTVLLTVTRGKERDGEYRYKLGTADGVRTIDLISDLVGEGGLRRTPVAVRPGIYRIEGGELTLCLAEDRAREGRGRPGNSARPSRFDPDLGILLTLKRKGPPKKAGSEQAGDIVAAWRKGEKDVTPTDLKVEVAAAARAERTPAGLVLPVTITNGSDRDITAALPGVGAGGGLWPPTDLYASVTPKRADKPVPFHPAFPAGDPPAAGETAIPARKSVTVRVRMDWRGTPSVRAEPLMDPGTAREYRVRLLLVFRAGNVRQFVAGGEQTVDLPAAGGPAGSGAPAWDQKLFTGAYMFDGPAAFGAYLQAADVVAVGTLTRWDAEKGGAVRVEKTLRGKAEGGEVAFTLNGGLVTAQAGDRVVVVLKEAKRPYKLHSHCGAPGLYEHSAALRKLVEEGLLEEKK